MFEWLFGSSLPADQPWADGPFALIPASDSDANKGLSEGSLFLAQEMSAVHNMLIRTINTIYLQAAGVSERGTPQDKADFVEYALLWADVVEGHHHIEETSYFPEIERLADAPGIMQPNVDQHHAFQPGLAAYSAYLKDVSAGTESPFDGARLTNILDQFMPVLTQHLHDEIQTLRGLGAYEDKTDWKKWSHGHTKAILDKAMADPNWKLKAVPLILVNNDMTFDGGALAFWVPMPWLAKLLFRFWYVPVHKRLWRFASTDAAGTPRALPFVDKKGL